MTAYRRTALKLLLLALLLAALAACGGDPDKVKSHSEPTSPPLQGKVGPGGYPCNSQIIRCID